MIFEIILTFVVSMILIRLNLNYKIFRASILSASIVLMFWLSMFIREIWIRFLVTGIGLFVLYFIEKWLYALYLAIKNMKRLCNLDSLFSSIPPQYRNIGIESFIREMYYQEGDSVVTIIERIDYDIIRNRFLSCLLCVCNAYLYSYIFFNFKKSAKYCKQALIIFNYYKIDDLKDPAVKWIADDIRLCNLLFDENGNLKQ